MTRASSLRTALVDLLSDEGWHTRGEMRVLATPIIPPEKAFRRGYWRLDRPLQRTVEEVLDAGRWAIIYDILRGLGYERDGERWRRSNQP